MASGDCGEWLLAAAEKGSRISTAREAQRRHDKSALLLFVPGGAVNIASQPWQRHWTGGASAAADDDAVWDGGRTMAKLWSRLCSCLSSRSR